MIAAFAPARRTWALTAACSLLARLARAQQIVAEAGQDLATPQARIAERLRERLDAVVAQLADAWPLIDLTRQASSTEAQTAELEANLASRSAELAGLERALLKLPGTTPPPEVTEVLGQVADPRTLAPVVLVADDTERDEDGFVPMPVRLVAAPLSWPQLAASAVVDDRAALAALGAAYLASQAERLLAGAGQRDLARRIEAMALELEATGGLPREVRVLAESALGSALGADEPSGAGPALEAAEFAAQRLQEGVLASARSTCDLATIRQGRERLLAAPRTTPDDVYEVLEGLREIPLSAAEILNGGWLAWQRSCPAWLTEALASERPARTFGRRVLALDSLVLKSLETAGVHRLMEGR